MFSRLRTSGFTLIEIMIVIAMIVILLGTSIFPYSYYMKRARLEKTLDAVSAEWIIAHQDIRSGKLHPSTKHASWIIDIKQGATTLDFYLTTGSTYIGSLERKLSFESGIQVL
jgi:prepilin-type N-terminal cleavage/methylation domain-containing protein